MIDNICIGKIWEEGDLLELKIKCKSKFVSALQFCYISKDMIINIVKLIREYIQNPTQNCILHFGEPQGNYTPAFSMTILSCDKYGHVKIEVNMEINDNDERKHWCQFFVESELGRIEFFASKLAMLTNSSVDFSFALNPN